MTSNETSIFVISWGIAVILFYKYFIILKKCKSMKKITCKCSDVILRTTYHKSTHVYFYTYVYDNEEYTTSDSTRFKLPFFSPKIGEVLELYINEKNANKTVSPLTLFYNKLFLLFSICSIILPFLLLI